jgi:hypothetical protein
MRTVQENDRDIRQFEEIVYTVQMKGEWWSNPHIEEPAIPVAPGGGREDYVTADATVRWNLGKKMHEVLIGDAVVYATPDKDLAHRIAAGDEPIPRPDAEAA